LEQVREFLPGKITRKYVGTGFGLPIARRNLRAHGGSIEVESVHHEGTRVILPPEPPTEDEL
jgi:signal transduction histidine kinase